jgi:signal transduction histidine kinase
MVILFLLGGIIYGMARRSALKRKLSRRLEEKNKALSQALVNLRNAEDQLIKSEKMAVFGKLSAGIAHEIRNPLNFITNFSELSLQIADDFVHTDVESERADMAVQLKKIVDKIGYHGRRADSIVTRMLQHSRATNTELEATDINRICEEFSELAYQSMRNTITNFSCSLEKRLDAAIPKIWVVPQDLSRVVINLLNNAFYAVHDKKFMHMNGYVPTVRISTRQQEGSVFIKVRDNGNGIPSDLSEKIFEPFFTTKPIGEGTGLGLSICADIVKAAGGEIKARSVQSEWTEFEVRLPINMQ